MYGNFLFHAFGGVVFKVKDWGLYPKLPFFELAEAVRATPHFAEQADAFVEFVMVLSFFSCATTLMIAFILVRRALGILGLVGPEKIERTKVLLGILLGLLLGVFPYFQGGELDKSFNFSLGFQMFYQTSVWLLTLSGAYGCIVVPERTHLTKEQLDKGM
ncbi:MAG: hypothetical protein AAGF50_11850 [Pseudomonadota bacterium]